MAEMSVAEWVYQFRGYLVAPPLIFAIFWSRFETEAEFIWPLGICLFAFGVGLRIWAQQHLHYRIKVHKTLTMKGPYSFVRNPIYIGNIIISIGAIVISELLWLVPLILIYYLGIYSLVILYEETHLLSKYGEPYRKYMADVPRWVPKALHLKEIRIINEYLHQSIVAEIHCLLLVLPFILKEIIN
jgi:protein-S-isoprenylcysteine O-methyltransferase Ste14